MEINKNDLRKIEYKRPQDDQVIDLYFLGKKLWLSEKQISRLYNVQVLSIRKHLRNAYKKEKLNEEEITAKVIDPLNKENFKRVYNLDAIKNIGHRINSQYVLKLEEWLKEAFKKK